MVEKKAAKKTAVKSEKKTIRKTTAKTAARAAAAADKQYASADVVQEKKAIRQIKSNNKKDVKEIKKLEKKERKVQSLGHISQVTGAVVDVRFDKVEDLPNILTALECDNHGRQAGFGSCPALGRKYCPHHCHGCYRRIGSRSGSG